MTQLPACTLALNGLLLPVFLGIYPEEKLKKQIVSIDIRLFFLTPPPGCLSDQLEETYCYDQLITQLKEGLASKHFNLLEKLGQDIHRLVKTQLPENIKITVRVTKSPAIPELSKGVTFEYGDDIQTSERRVYPCSS